MSQEQNNFQGNTVFKEIPVYKRGVRRSKSPDINRVK